jgi:hypothetical protein
MQIAGPWTHWERVPLIITTQHTLLLTFTSPWIVIDFFLNNQRDALIIQILFCYKTLHVSGNSFAHHQEFTTVHSAVVSFMHVFDDISQAKSGWNSMSSILTLLRSGHQKPAWNFPVPNVQQKTSDNGQRSCPKHVEFYDRIKFG